MPVESHVSQSFDGTGINSRQPHRFAGRSGSICSFQPAWSEWIDFVPEAVEPAFVLSIADSAFAYDLNGGVGNIVTQYGVIPGHVFGAHYAAQNNCLPFTAERGVPLSLQHQIAIWQHINNPHGDFCHYGF